MRLLTRVIPLAALLGGLAPALAIPSGEHLALHRAMNRLPRQEDMDPGMNLSTPAPLPDPSVSFNSTVSIGDLANNHTRITASLCVILGVNYTDPVANLTQLDDHQLDTPMYIGRSVFIRLLRKCIGQQRRPKHGDGSDDGNGMDDLPDIDDGGVANTAGSVFAFAPSSAGSPGQPSGDPPQSNNNPVTHGSGSPHPRPDSTGHGNNNPPDHDGNSGTGSSNGPPGNSSGGNSGERHSQPADGNHGDIDEASPPQSNTSGDGDSGHPASGSNASPNNNAPPSSGNHRQASGAPSNGNPSSGSHPPSSNGDGGQPSNPGPNNNGDSTSGPASKGDGNGTGADNGNGPDSGVAHPPPPKVNLVDPSSQPEGTGGSTQPAAGGSGIPNVNIVDPVSPLEGAGGDSPDPEFAHIPIPKAKLINPPTNGAGIPNVDIPLEGAGGDSPDPGFAHIPVPKVNLINPPTNGADASSLPAALCPRANVNASAMACVKASAST